MSGDPNHDTQKKLEFIIDGDSEIAAKIFQMIIDEASDEFIQFVLEIILKKSDNPS